MVTDELLGHAFHATTCFTGASGIRWMLMKARVIRIFVLLWLSWYIWGPVDPMVDFWDTPRQTMSDMERAASGIVVLMAAGFAVALLQRRNLRDRFRFYSHITLGLVASASDPITLLCLSISFSLQPIHSPPVLLRI
jgi:hypothetical protein